MKGILASEMSDMLSNKNIDRYIQEADANNYGSYYDTEDGYVVTNAYMNVYRDDDTGKVSRVYVNLNLLLPNGEKIEVVLEDEMYGEGFYYVR